MTVLFRDDYTWINGGILSANTVAFWDWLDGAFDTLNGDDTDPASPTRTNRILATVTLIPHARRAHPCLYRTDDLSGPCLPGRLIGAEARLMVSDGYDETWRP